jgi:hypothetical protein
MRAFALIIARAERAASPDLVCIRTYYAFAINP